MIKKYLVIGNPIEHSLSPKLHNYWLKENNINATYDKKKLEEKDLQSIIYEVKEKKINGINVTVPFKKAVIPFLDELSPEAKDTQSVNTIYFQNGITIGHNTDIAGFELAIKYSKYDIYGKKIFILGAGGVAPSIIYSLKKMKASKITLTNRTKEKAENLKKLFPQIELVEWGDIKDFDMIINTTSLGLKENDKVPINYDQIGPGKFFYDVIYNPKKTNFLFEAKKRGHKIENGKMMFVYQAQAAFGYFTKAPNARDGLIPSINKKILQLLEND